MTQARRLFLTVADELYLAITDPVQLHHVGYRSCPLFAECNIVFACPALIGMPSPPPELEKIGTDREGVPPVAAQPATRKPAAASSDSRKQR